MKKFEDNEKKMQNNLKEKFELVYVQHFSENKVEALKYIQNNEVLSSYFSQKPISVTHSTFHPPTLFI